MKCIHRKRKSRGGSVSEIPTRVWFTGGEGGGGDPKLGVGRGEEGGRGCLALYNFLVQFWSVSDWSGSACVVSSLVFVLFFCFGFVGFGFAGIGFHVSCCIFFLVWFGRVRAGRVRIAVFPGSVLYC